MGLIQRIQSSLASNTKYKRFCVGLNDQKEIRREWYPTSFERKKREREKKNRVIKINGEREKHVHAKQCKTTCH